MDEEREPQWRLLLSSAIQIAQAMAFLHEESIIFGSLNAYRCLASDCLLWALSKNQVLPPSFPGHPHA